MEDIPKRKPEGLIGLFIQCFLLLMIGGIPLPQVASAIVPGDYDGDEKSDLAVAQVNRAAQSTIWYVRLTSGAPALGYNFPGAGDALVTGRYFKGDTRVFPGIVRVTSLTSPLEWMVKNPVGATLSVLYGSPGDTVPNQGDLDCDGVTDFVVARAGTPGHYQGFKLWYVALSAKPGLVQEMLFGLAGDRIGTADMDGDGCSELLALRDDYTWYSRKLFNDNVTAVQWGLPGDVALLPQDFTGDGIADYVVARNFGNQMYGILRQPNGQAQLTALGTSTSVPLIGNFIGANWYAWVERATSFIGVAQFDGGVSVFPFSLPTNHIIRPDGTVIQPLVAEAAAAPAVSGSNGVQCDSQIKRNDGSGGFKNNPENSRGTIKIMFPKQYTGNIDEVNAYGPDGKFIEELSEGDTLEWGERERYYGHKSLRSYPNNLVIQIVLKSGKTACTTLADPGKVYE